MNSLNDKLKIVRDALKDLGPEVYHYWRPVSKPQYIIWAEDSEDSEGSFHSDNHKTSQDIHGTIDLFTQTEYDPVIDSIQDALDNSPRIAWRLNSVQYEDETAYIHYEWEFEVA